MEDFDKNEDEAEKKMEETEDAKETADDEKLNK